MDFASASSMRSMLASAPSSARCMEAPAAWKSAVPSPNQPVSGFSTMACTPRASAATAIGLVRGRAGADVQDLHLVQQGIEGGERAQAARLGEALGVGRGRRVDADEVDVGAVDALDALVVQVGGEAGPDDPAAHLRLARCRHSSPYFSSTDGSQSVSAGM